MALLPEPTMTADEFLAWAEARPGRHELLDGRVFALSPQRVRHADVKFAAQTALRAAIARDGLPCHMLPDGMSVRVDRASVFEPDALVYCGERAPGDAVTIDDPVIVVEVLSPVTRVVDTGAKLAGYFRLPSVIHYLILDPDRRLAIHHRRGAGDLIETRIVPDGPLDLSPPGLTLAVADLFADP